MKVLVCGGRNYRDYVSLRDMVDRFSPTWIINGGARGADTLASQYADEKGIPCAVVRAPWSTHGPSAGPVRNRWMLDLEPDWVIAFPGGRGTADMIRAAREKKIPVTDLSPSALPDPQESQE